MKISFMLCLLLLLTGCAARDTPLPPGSETAPEAMQDITLSIGTALPLPVSGDSIREFYLSSDGFRRHVLDLQEVPGGYLVRSVPLPYSGPGESPPEDARFDWVYTETGNCYALLEGPYTMEDVTNADQGGISLYADHDPLSCPSVVYAAVDPALVFRDSGVPLPQHGLTCASRVSVHPAAFSLRDGPLLTRAGVSALQETWDITLTGAYLGADSLELLFSTDHGGLPPPVKISYDAETLELTVLLRNTQLDCTPAGSNLYVSAVWAETRGTDTAVTCSMIPTMPDDFLPQKADQFTAETEVLPGSDWDSVVLRLTFWPFMG